MIAISQTPVGLNGLGVILTPEQIYQYALNAGFPADVAQSMTAIALRESSGNTNALNKGTNDNPEYSFGLWQINMDDKLGAARLNQFGLSNFTDLYDPQTNANAAYKIWLQSNGNLDTAWYTEHGGWYTEQYQKLLSYVQRIFNSGSSGISNSFDTGYDYTSMASSGLDISTIGLGVLAIGGLLLMLGKARN